MGKDSSEYLHIYFGQKTFHSSFFSFLNQLKNLLQTKKKCFIVRECTTNAVHSEWNGGN